MSKRVAACLAALIFMGTSVTYAASSKYKRSSKTSTTDSDASGPNPNASPTPAPNESGDQKVDLTQLENRYWTAKDTEFNVVQNRLYTKAKKFSVAPLVGADLSSQYTSDYNAGIAVHYYFSEREGVELQGWKNFSSEASFATQLEQQQGASYNYNIPQFYIGANYNWIPIYAKLSLLEKKIIYFDLSISPGLGLTSLQSKTFSTPTAPSNTVSSMPLTFALDISQQFFLDQHWALKFDLDNHFYQETTYWAAAQTSPAAPAGSPISSKITYSAIFMLGVTYFFR